ncbi:hypothetical protein D6D26_01243 [Aureobasidium pullulans]|nr:hypothetical protein D6D26_01243 [Aureobasidium pullulans]
MFFKASTDPKTGGTCWMKNQVGLPTSAGTNSLIGVLKAAAPTSTIAAVPTAPVQEDYSCPENDRQRVIDNYGGVYTLACSSDTSGGGAFAGDSPDFNGCFEKCDSTVNCVGFTYDGNNCYLKTGAANSISFVPAASNFVGAIRNVPSDGNLYSVTPSSTPPQTTTVYGTQTQFNTLTQTQTAHPSARDFVFDHNINCHLDCPAASSEHEHHNCDEHNLWPNSTTNNFNSGLDYHKYYNSRTTTAPAPPASTVTTTAPAPPASTVTVTVTPLQVQQRKERTNGVLGFGITSSYQPAALPQYTALSPTGYAVIPFWADLYIAQGTSQGIYYQVDGTAGSRIMTFEYYATYYNKTANYYHFQILFYENNPNSFTFKYLNVTDNGVNAVVGYQCQPSKQKPAAIASKSRR